MHERFHPSYSAGLSEDEVSIRKQQNLTNHVQSKMTKTNWQIIREGAFTLFNAYNLLIGICLMMVGAYANLAYLLVIIQNSLFRIVQEMHAKKMVENLYVVGASKARVVRSGKEIDIPVEEIVLDDITVLDMGKQICADSVILHGEIEVNESLLTGESDSVMKRPGDTLLSGSFVVSGKCYAKVEHVGEDNFATKLAQEAKKHKKVNSVLLNTMGKVTRVTGFFIVPIGILLFLEAYFLRLDPMHDAVVSTAAALLGMLPKGLVLLVSFSLVIGVIKLSRKKVIVQELYCIETLAHVDTLCLDKTGTLTEGKMSVSDIFPIDVRQMPLPLEEALGNFVNATDDNNATFIALKERFSPQATRNPLSKIPFSSERKWGAISFENVGSLILGAPEKLLQHSESILPTEVTDAQKSGKRMLCLGYSPDPVIGGALPAMTLVAAIGLEDPIRKNAKETLDFFREEGVEVKIISGDHPLTVSSVAKQAGLQKYDSYIDLSQIESEDDIRKAAEEYSIFARVLPSQKKLLIRALQAQGHTVAMTGDGVNDVLALKESDCSIAMASGSEAAKQVAQLVLLNSDFTALPDILMEGRRVVNSITRTGGIFFIKTIYTILLTLFACITVTPFPFIPIQITFLDIMIEGYTPFFLTFEPSNKKVQGSLFRKVAQRALPYALLIVLSVLAITAIYPLLSMTKADASTTMYYFLAFTGLLAVIQTCYPFNLWRAFLCTTTTLGVYVGIYLFTDILHLERLSATSLALFLGLAAIAIPLSRLFAWLVGKAFDKAFGKE